MKTPEEIKLEIQECCEQIADCGPFWWSDGEYTEQVLGDALALIRKLEAIADEQEQIILDKEAEIERLEELNAEQAVTIARLMAAVEGENESNTDH